MGSRVSRIEYYLPTNVLTNSDIEIQFPEWNATKVEKKIGIRQRHIAAADETSLDLAVMAAQKLLCLEDPSQIDFLFFCTQSPDYLLPTSACIIQEKLGLSKSIGALDFNLGCSGYVYGLALAKALIKSGISKGVLLLTGETYSKLIADDDVSNRSIFGDAGTATLIVHSEDEHIGEFVFGTDGSGAENLIVPNSGARGGFTSPLRVNSKLFMNGPEIFNFTIESIPLLIQATLTKNKIGLNDIDYLILHQANKYILEFLIGQIGFDIDKCHIDMLNYGNTVSNTIPIALHDAFSTNRITRGNKVALSGFGVGYSWGATIITI